MTPFINSTTPPGSTNAIVSANHHDHFDRWLDRANANTDHVNAHIILELQAAQRKAIDAGEEPYALQLYLRDRLTVPTIFLDRNTPFVPGKKVDYSQHFDMGANGSRGSAAAMAKCAMQMTGGHSHSAHIIRSSWQVGTCTGRMGYQSGLSSHTNTHQLEYQNGKRTLIDVFNARWRGD